MLKHVFWMVVASAAVIFFVKETAFVMEQLDHFHNFFAQHMKAVFSGGSLGQWIRRTLALLLVPVSITAVISGAYYIVKKSLMPYTFIMMWILWVIMATSISH